MAHTNREATGDKCNKTQLNVEVALGRMIVHRDINAHWFRFAHICKLIKHNDPKVILDVGCGNKQLAMALYSNKHSKGVKEYHCVDLRDITTKGLEGKEPFPIVFHKQNVCENLPKVEPDIIVNFEVIEHVTRENGMKLLDALHDAMVEKTTLYLSTPCYDEKKGAADNHIWEYEYQELKDELSERFEIINHWGTFADTGIGENKKYFDKLFGEERMAMMREFFHSSLLSNMLAPFVPERARNCMWKLKLKSV